MVASADPGIPDRRRSAGAGADGQAWQAALHPRYRWLHDVPLRDGRDALIVNWFEIQIINARGETTYRNSFVTDLPVGPDTVVELAACGRARWKIENETFNVLKNNGYNLEQLRTRETESLRYPGEQTCWPSPCIPFATSARNSGATRTKLGPRYNFFSKLAAITAYLIFPSWDDGCSLSPSPSRHQYRRERCPARTPPIVPPNK